VRKTWSGKSNDEHDAIFFEKNHFQNIFRPHENEKLAFSKSSVFMIGVDSRLHDAFSNFYDGV